MLMTDIIANKRDGKALSPEEIGFFVTGYTNGDIPDYQMSALLMAIVLNGMDEAETATLTAAMAASGERANLSAIEGCKVDKHSTGGVGDKTTLIVGPIVAACGVKVAKMSGRGLGHTGGTVDKLEAIPGFRVELSPEEFTQQVNEVGIAVVGQSGDLAPADKKLYALRDVTATVDSLPLIASSIMSKKLASGANAILLDVKAGSGAFMKTLADASALAKAMVDIGTANGVATAAVVTDMDTPLGCAIGNSMEIAECVATLRGEGPEDLAELCLTLAAEMLVLAGKGDALTCHRLASEAVENGSALQKLRQMVAAQGGDTAVIDDPARFPKAAHRHEVPAPEDGTITAMDTTEIGKASVLLGAGRPVKGAPIDYAAGIQLLAKTGSPVQKGQPIAVLYTEKAETIPEAENRLLAACTFGSETPAPTPPVLARVDKNGVQNPI